MLSNYKAQIKLRIEFKTEDNEKINNIYEQILKRKMYTDEMETIKYQAVRKQTVYRNTERHNNAISIIVKLVEVNYF